VERPPLSRLRGRGRPAPRDHRQAVGGLWDEIGELQFEFLRSQGLEPEHHLLDCGCGSLRGGVRFVAYLESGHYCGIDADGDLLAAGRRELEQAGLDGKAVQLRHSSSFDVAAFDRRFDFALAQSLFTHLDINAILRCILSVERVLKPGGTFFATYFRSPSGTRDPAVLSAAEHPTSDGMRVTTSVDADPYHYGFDLFEWLCEPTSLTVQEAPNFQHPRDQRMLALVKSP
jgi:SAM-dependent methyltransferase